MPLPLPLPGRCFRSHHVSVPEGELPGYLDEARAIFADAAVAAAGAEVVPHRLSTESEHMRWFSMGDEIVAELRTKAPQ